NREPDEQQGIVVAGCAVQIELATAAAAVDEQPFAVAADGDAQRLHQRPAFGRAVTRRVVEVPAPQAQRAVVPMAGAGRAAGDVGAAVAAAERESFART